MKQARRRGAKARTPKRRARAKKAARARTAKQAVEKRRAAKSRAAKSRSTKPRVARKKPARAKPATRVPRQTTRVPRQTTRAVGAEVVASLERDVRRLRSARRQLERRLTAAVQEIGTIRQFEIRAQVLESELAKRDAEIDRLRTEREEQLGGTASIVSTPVSPQAS